jgi:hypothetical protein
VSGSRLHESLREMYLDSQLVALDKVRATLLRDPEALDNRKKGDGNAEGNSQCGAGKVERYLPGT